jgi:hypothetical protein
MRRFQRYVIFGTFWSFFKSISGHTVTASTAFSFVCQLHFSSLKICLQAFLHSKEPWTFFWNTFSNVFTCVIRICICGQRPPKCLYPSCHDQAESVATLACPLCSARSQLHFFLRPGHMYIFSLNHSEYTYFHRHPSTIDWVCMFVWW